MPTLRIPTPLRAYTTGQSEVQVEGATVSEALDNLIAIHPALKPHLYSDSEELRPFVNLFLGEENIKELQGLATPLKSDDRLMLVPSIAGG
ncbi:MAG: molybdopterin synthase sulfur carrier subunit [Anaerolineae bacterium UTCFX2]|jgi:molybdopterin converting factor small subunit|nr:MoaD/ThiS family protein [Anaerolineae bacterium]MCZ7552699.1 MoaD/ThiS family protein [Anaerolineales bacterium]OQY94241.1 MAG: molybdopterin synthase sulfur carrier subunit [Anaerolineae bacterium UTCFX2]